MPHAPPRPRKGSCEAHHATHPARRAGKCVLAPAELVPIEVFQQEGLWRQQQEEVFQQEVFQQEDSCRPTWPGR